MSTAAVSEVTKGTDQGISVEVREGEVCEQKEKKPERKRDRVVTPYTKLVNRVRGLISRIRCCAREKSLEPAIPAIPASHAPIFCNICPAKSARFF